MEINVKIMQVCVQYFYYTAWKEGLHNYVYFNIIIIIIFALNIFLPTSSHESCD